MLADPQSITIAGTTISIPRTGIGGDSAVYTSADGTVSLRIQQTVNKTRRRTIISLQSNKIAADALTAVNQRVQSVLTFSFNTPVDGFTITELKDQLVGLSTLLTASSAAMAIKVLGGEK